MLEQGLEQYLLVLIWQGTQQSVAYAAANKVWQWHCVALCVGCVLTAFDAVAVVASVVGNYAVRMQHDQAVLDSLYEELEQLNPGVMSDARTEVQ